MIFQALFSRINLKRRLKECSRHMTMSPIFGRHLVVLLLIVHLLIGFINRNSQIFLCAIIVIDIKWQIAYILTMKRGLLSGSGL